MGLAKLAAMKSKTSMKTSHLGWPCQMSELLYYNLGVNDGHGMTIVQVLHVNFIWYA
jgi:hypothetical protein